MGESLVSVSMADGLSDISYLYENYLTKSEYKRYRRCAAAFWESFKDTREEQLDLVSQSNIAQGHLVETKALELFPGLRSVPKTDIKTSSALTQAFMVEGSGPISQATVVSPHGLLTRSDVISWNSQLKGWDIYEIKGVTGLTSEHFEDLAFQQYVFEQAGLPVARTFLVYLNYGYRRGEKLDIKKLFKTRNVTHDVNYTVNHSRLPYEARRARKVKRHALLTTEARPHQIVCTCWSKPAQDRCSYFYEIYPDIPTFSSFDIRLKGRNKSDFYENLFAGKHYAIEDIPPTLTAQTGAKQDWIELYKGKETRIDTEAVKEELDSLTYPLYFLDYETAKSAIPHWEGTGPYQQIVFQYSLHVLTAPREDPTSELLHYEYLATDESDPTAIIAENLMAQIGSEGSVIVWNKSFEQGRNKEIGERYPSSQEFFEDLNSRVFDLMTIFRRGLYQDWRFKGSSSIKNVLPVVCPDVSYDDLEFVANGGEAMTLWPLVIFDSSHKKDREKIFKALKAYCGLDTYAMVRIYEHLLDKISD